MNTESNFTKWFDGRVLAAFAVGSVVAGIVIYINTPITDLKISQATIMADIATIKDNDIVHIELEIAKIEKAQTDQVAATQDLNDKIIEVLTRLKK